MAVKIISIAIQAQKPIVLEQLNFKNKKMGKKFNRMSHNFVYRKMIAAIKSCALKSGVEVIEVPAAYTSIVGKLKYMNIYNLSVHNALVLQALAFPRTPKRPPPLYLIYLIIPTFQSPTQRRSVTLKKKSLLWFKSKFRVCQKQPALTAPCLAAE